MRTPNRAVDCPPDQPRGWMTWTSRLRPDAGRRARPALHGGYEPGHGLALCRCTLGCIWLYLPT
jgi:hypothetical protein